MCIIFNPTLTWTGSFMLQPHCLSSDTAVLLFVGSKQIYLRQNTKRHHKGIHITVRNVMVSYRTLVLTALSNTKNQFKITCK
jgi:hypothetical protein